MKNAILICIDCLRYDRLVRDTAPFLVDLCHERGVALEQAYAAAPWTYPSTHSILTGLYPHHHGARHDGIYRERVFQPPPGLLNDELPTIFSLLHSRGFRTLGISTIYWALNKNCNYPGCERIVRSQKQEQFYVNTRAQWVIDSFIDDYQTNCDRRDPFFAYLHLIDLHRPFDLEVALEHADPGTVLLDGIDDWDCRVGSEDADHVSRFRQNKLKLYEGLIRYVDKQIQRLVEFLKDRGVFDDTTLVVTADHGEEFWDHREFEMNHYACGRKSSEPWLMGTGHGHTLFNELLHVPMIFLNPPNALHPSALRSPVSGVDILPTLLSFLDINLDLALDGRSLTEKVESREVLAESTLYGFERKAIIKGNFKIISSPGDSHCALYDLLLDPGERNPIIEGIDPAMVDRLTELHGNHRRAAELW